MNSCHDFVDIDGLIIDEPAYAITIILNHPIKLVSPKIYRPIVPPIDPLPMLAMESKSVKYILLIAPQIAVVISKAPAIFLALAKLIWFIFCKPKKIAMVINHRQGSSIPRPVQFTKEYIGWTMKLGNVPAQKVVMIIGKQNEAAIPIHKIAAVVLIGEFGSLFVVCSFIPYLYSVFKQEGSINTFTTV